VYYTYSRTQLYFT